MNAEQIHPDLLKAIDAAGIPHNQIALRYGDVYVMHQDHATLGKLKQAGPWRSMAEITRTNPKHPDAKAWPWLLDVPLANLSQYFSEKAAGKTD